MKTLEDAVLTAKFEKLSAISVINHLTIRRDVTADMLSVAEYFRAHPSPANAGRLLDGALRLLDEYPESTAAEEMIQFSSRVLAYSDHAVAGRMRNLLESTPIDMAKFIPTVRIVWKAAKVENS